MTGVSIPAGFTSEGMPFAITVLGQSFTEGMVLEIAQRFERTFGKPVGVDARASSTLSHFRQFGHHVSRRLLLKPDSIFSSFSRILEIFRKFIISGFWPAGNGK
jgi:hypothetical protein